jgi:hypothetical protein
MKALVLAALFVVVVAPAAIALPVGVDDSATVVAFTEAESEGNGEDVPATTMISEGGVEPAELAPPVDESVAEDQWTAKFLAPAVALLGVLGVVAAVALYGVRLRGRYRVVE